MEPILAGYFPKRTARRPEGFGVPQVEEIASASCCISEGPFGDAWIQKWRHNGFYLFDDKQAAWDILAPDEWTSFDMYAFAIFPIQFDEGVQQPLVLPRPSAEQAGGECYSRAASTPPRTAPPLSIEPLADSFVRLGYDVVSRSSGAGFECSPLSCNGAAMETPVNRYCLLDDARAAFALARRCSISADGWEPGPYLVVEVWREESCARPA